MSVLMTRHPDRFPHSDTNLSSESFHLFLSPLNLCSIFFCGKSPNTSLKLVRGWAFILFSKLGSTRRWGYFHNYSALCAGTCYIKCLSVNRGINYLRVNCPTKIFILPFKCCNNNNHYCCVFFWLNYKL